MRPDIPGRLGIVYLDALGVLSGAAFDHTLYVYPEITNPVFTGGVF